jgi:hypothetical protein
MARPGSWQPPDGKTEKTRTSKANATPRLGQKKKSPYARMKDRMAQMQKQSFGQDRFNYGRTRMIP